MRNLSVFIATLLLLSGCSEPAPPAAVEEVEMLSRTEFTDRIENFFEYAPFQAGKPSQFLIHLTDLSDGTPVEQAEVKLVGRPSGGNGAPSETTAKVGRVKGIYVAELTPSSAGDYDLEFHIKNPKLEVHMPLSGFKVE